MITTDDNLWPLVKLRINFTGGLQILTTNIETYTNIHLLIP